MSRAKLVLRLGCGCLIGILPGLIWFFITGYLAAIPVIIFGGMIGTGLAVPGTSPIRVAGGFIQQLGVPGADVAGDMLMKADEGDEEPDDLLGEWILRGRRNPTATRRIIMGSWVGLATCSATLLFDSLVYFADMGDSVLLPMPPVHGAFAYAMLLIAGWVHGAALFGLTILGSHWKGILSLGAVGGVFAVVIAVGLNRGSDQVALLAFALLPSSLGFGLGTLLGMQSISGDQP